MMTWKERALAAATERAAAIAAWHEQEQEAARCQRVSALQRLLRQVLENESLTVTACPALLDGEWFTAREADLSGYAPRWTLHLMQSCPSCRASRYSYPLRSIEDVGAQLRDFQSEYHYCESETAVEPQTEEPTPTPAERLIAALRGWLEAELEGQR